MMDRNGMDENNKKLLLLEMRKRLDWYTFQAPSEQFDAQEVEMLVKQIGELESPSGVPKQEMQADFEALKRYREEKSMDAERLAALHGERTFGAMQRRLLRPLHGFWAKRGHFVKAAAIGIAVLLTVGSAGTVNAQEDGEPIRWLRKDLEFEVMVREPQGEKWSWENDVEGMFTYDSLQELPQMYQDYLIDFGELDGMEGYEQRNITLSSNPSSWFILSVWQAMEGEKRRYRAFYLDGVKESVTVWNRGFDFESGYRMEIDGMEVTIRQKPKAYEEGQDTTAYFYYEGRTYALGVEGSPEFAEQLAAEYMEKILEKNENF